MNLRTSMTQVRSGQFPVRRYRSNERATVLIIVLWIAFGLVSLALYFGHSMSLEMRATDNRAAAVEADEAIAGALRYVTNILGTATNGMLPDTNSYQFANVPIGDATFWLIGRGDSQLVTPDRPVFGLVAENSKLNLNTATLEMLQYLPRMTPELAAAIIDWRDTDETVTTGGAENETYARLNPAYKCKNAPFESIEELRLVYGMDTDILYGEDVNLNGVLDANENDGEAAPPFDNHDGILDPGILEYVTIYSREPTTDTNGTARINIASLTAAKITSVLQTNFTTARAAQIINQLGLTTPVGGGRGGRGGPPPTPPTITIASPLAFYMRSGMTADEFALIDQYLTVATGPFVEGRVNINTAGAAVLACLPGCDASTAQQMIAYRQANPDRLTSIAWIADALSGNTTVLAALQARDILTVQSYQFTADIAALGHFGRGYHRVKFVLDTADGTPAAVRYRQDLTHLGWALGKQTRELILTSAKDRQ